MQAIEEPAIVAYFRHNTWANLKLLDACEGLSDEQLDLTAPGTFGTIRETLLHIVLNEQNYLSLLTAQAPENPLHRGQWPGIADLKERAGTLGAALAAQSARVQLTTVLRPTFQGQEVDLPAYIVLLQAINHGAEHRTHITTIMSHHGLEAPALDAWAFNDEL